MKKIALRRVAAVALVLALTQPTLAAAQDALRQDDLRVEPPSWWTGFDDPSLQLIVYGPGVGDDAPALSADAPARLIGHTPGAHADVLIVTLEVTAEAGPAGFDLTLTDPQSGAIRALPYALRDRDPGSAEREGFGPQDVIYLVVPDRFANGDPSNDIVEGLRQSAVDRADAYARHGGDLKGLRDRLPWLADLGVTALWLTPVLENDQPDGSYHGYAATDLYRIDRRFGSNADYRALVAEAKALGIKVIKDIVLNHVGDHHPWMTTPPTATWANRQADGGLTVTNHLRTTLADPYAAAHDRSGFQSGWFVESMPDLNQSDPVVATYLIQQAIWWIEDAGLSGVRLDTYPYVDSAFMGVWLDRVLTEYPNLNIVGEEWSLNPVVVARWQRGPEPGPAPSGETEAAPPLTPSLMDFPLQHALRRALTEGDAWNSGWLPLYEFMINDRAYANPGALTTLLDNHDFDRIHTQLGRDAALTKMALVHLLTMRGAPQLFYGTEWLEANDKPGDHGDIRRDAPGGWAGDATSVFDGRNLSPEQADMLDFTRKLATWRKGASAVHAGALEHYAPDAHGAGPHPHRNVYVYFRYDNDQTVMVVLNKARQPVALELQRFAARLAGKTEARDVITGEVFTLSAGLTAPPRSALVLEVK